LIRIAAIQGHIPETVAFIDEKVPGFSNLQRMNIPTPMLAVRMRQIHAMSQFYTQAELDSYMAETDKLTRQYTGGEGVEETSARVYTGFLILRGELEEARNVVLNRILTSPASQFLDWQEFFRQPAFRELTSDREIQDELDRWEEQQKAWQKEARAILIEEGLI
jgi:hypothetical protein